jgi:hypothetical protein
MAVFLSPNALRHPQHFDKCEIGASVVCAGAVKQRK